MMPPGRAVAMMPVVATVVVIPMTAPANGRMVELENHHKGHEEDDDGTAHRCTNEGPRIGGGILPFRTLRVFCVHHHRKGRAGTK